MHDYSYIKNELCCGDIKLSEIAADVGTPFYCYSLPTLRRHIKAFEEPLKDVPHQTCFSMKSNANMAILSFMSSMGLGADVVSGGELFKAMKAGIPAERIVYSGAGKTTAEIDMALEAGIMMFNIESPEELDVVNERAGIIGKKAPIAIRVNPDVDPKTHPYISTGMKKNKFGIDIEGSIAQYMKAKNLPHVETVGIDCHIGSQLTEISPFRDAAERLKILVGKLRENSIALKYLDLGGGLGITYSNEEPPQPADYAKTVIEEVGGLGLKLVFEPGRVLVGNIGVLVTTVQYRKVTPAKTFIIVDAGMNDLVRPSLYDAYHEIKPLLDRKTDVEKVDVVGPICESSDFLAKDRDLPQVGRGDMLAVMSAGAYGFAMSSNYNARTHIPEVLVDGNRYFVVRKRQTYEELISGEIIPESLLGG
ncbi:MAG TPA: diaminopimelate decarboxylase [Desulfomonilia bacterium]